MPMPTSLLTPYTTLVQQHQVQFSPSLKQLRDTVEATLHQLQQEERALVAAQAQDLAELRQYLATDARCLLTSTELVAFVAQVQAIRAEPRWNQTQPDPELDADPTRWQLAQTDLAIALRDYTPTVDHDAYDDERTHSTYSYTLTVQVEKQTQCLEVVTHRVYSPIDRRDDNLRQQLYYYVEGQVKKLLPSDLSDTLKAQLAKEISYLCGCAVQLLTLTPQTVQFHYSSLEATA
jgi:hypothetical protein